MGVDPVGFSVGHPVGVGPYHSVGLIYVGGIDPVGFTVGGPLGVGTYHSVDLISVGGC